MSSAVSTPRSISPLSLAFAETPTPPYPPHLQMIRRKVPTFERPFPSAQPSESQSKCQKRRSSDTNMATRDGWTIVSSKAQSEKKKGETQSEDHFGTIAKVDSWRVKISPPETTPLFDEMPVMEK